MKRSADLASRWGLSAPQGHSLFLWWARVSPASCSCPEWKLLPSAETWLGGGFAAQGAVLQRERIVGLRWTPPYSLLWARLGSRGPEAL